MNAQTAQQLREETRSSTGWVQATMTGGVWDGGILLMAGESVLLDTASGTQSGDVTVFSMRLGREIRVRSVYVQQRESTA